MKKIEIYTSDTCVQCKMAKEYFQKNNLEIIYGIDMLINQALEAFYIWTGINPCNEDFEHIKKLYENSI